jgi:hypothetical protein
VRVVQFGPQERALLESAATTLYEEIVDAGGLGQDDPRIGADGECGRAFALLRELRLVSLDQGESVWRAVDPATVQSQVVTPLGQRGAELISESASWARAFGALGVTWRRSPSATQGPFTVLSSEQIHPYLSSAVADASEELLTAQPQIGRVMDQLQTVMASEIELLQRGVRVRTLYQHSARRNTDTRRYVAEVTEAGAEVRTLDEFFNRMIVIDQRIAVIPGRDGPAVALAVQEPSVVAYLVDVFERSWERARPFTDQGQAQSRAIAEEQRAMTIRMLIEGYADQTSAKRVGVSPRTYAGYVADLKAELDVETRFQLGYAMGREGISGNETSSET